MGIEKKVNGGELLNLAQWIPLLGIIPAAWKLKNGDSVWQNSDWKYVNMLCHYTASIPIILKICDYFG